MVQISCQLSVDVDCDAVLSFKTFVVSWQEIGHWTKSVSIFQVSAKTPTKQQQPISLKSSDIILVCSY